VSFERGLRNIFSFKERGMVEEHSEYVVSFEERSG
jgi:hypothetical protein